VEVEWLHNQPYPSRGGRAATHTLECTYIFMSYQNIFSNKKHNTLISLCHSH